MSFNERFRFAFDDKTYKRKVSDKDVIVHCHHYNARLQGTIESATLINGKEIIKSSAESVFAEHLKDLFQPTDSKEEKWQVAAYYYTYLGFGHIDFSKVSEGIVTADSSHYVEGWITGFQIREDPVCSFTEGYVQGAYYAIEGKSTWVHEISCMIQGTNSCQFTLDHSRTTTPEPIEKSDLKFKESKSGLYLKSTNVDQELIIDSIVKMPFVGDEEGLIPLFNVYLANTPADFYNLVCIKFVVEMTKVNLEDVAKKLLIYCGEICGLHTFRGVMNSVEWDGLIAPMIMENRDRLFAIIAVSNSLGWGNWHIKELTEGRHLTLDSLNGYEAMGYLTLKGVNQDPQCHMLNGVSTGIMELIYTEGSMEDKVGTFSSSESMCIAKGDSCCKFEVNNIS